MGAEAIFVMTGASWLLLLLAAAFVASLIWAWSVIPLLDCPRCRSLNTIDIDSPVGDRVICNDCGYEWGNSD